MFHLTCPQKSSNYQTKQNKTTTKPEQERYYRIIRRAESQFPDKNQYREDVKQDSHIQLLRLNRWSTVEESLSWDSDRQSPGKESLSFVPQSLTTHKHTKQNKTYILLF